jgi:hypothetical protein
MQFSISIAANLAPCYLLFQTLADEIGIPFLETSAKDATNVENAFMTMAGEIKNRLQLSIFSEFYVAAVSHSFLICQYFESPCMLQFDCGT